MPKIISKLLLSFLTGIILLISIAPAAPAKAADTWYSSGWPGFYSKVYGGSDPAQIFGERYTAAQVQWVFYGWFSMIINWILSATPITQQQLSNLMTGNLSDAGAALHTITNASSNNTIATNPNSNLISVVFADRSFSGITYVKNIVRKFHIIPQTNAASPGFGYSALDPVLPLWTATRNISYMFFVIVILIMAFMIMFRVKISPQVVISVQSALPKIAVALVLVTFSYAIAGFLIDLMYVVIGLLSIVFSSVFASAGMSFALGKSIPTNPVGLFTVLTQGFQQSGIFGFLILYFVDFLVSFLIIVIVTVQQAFASLTLGGAVAGVAFATLGVLLAVVFFIVMVFVLLWMSIKILITLIKAFAMILVLTIILPLMIVFGVVMSGIGFGAWLKLYIANLAVFPIVGALFMLSFIFMGQAVSYAESNIISFKGVSGVSNIIAIPSKAPINNAGWPPLMGGATVGGTALGLLFVSFFVLAMTPKAAEVASMLINGKGNFGNALGEAVGVGTGTIQQYMGYRSGQRKASMETDIRGFESAGDYGNAERLRKKMAREGQLGSAVGRIFGGK